MPQQDRVHMAQGRVGPRNEIEKLVVEVWAEVLERDDFGVHDDFFHLGGHSLQVARSVNKLQQITGLSLDLRAFFANPTAAGLAEHVVAQFAELEESQEHPAAAED
jgi:hypothetical protein